MNKKEQKQLLRDVHAELVGLRIEATNTDINTESLDILISRLEEHLSLVVTSPKEATNDTQGVCASPTQGAGCGAESVLQDLALGRDEAGVYVRLDTPTEGSTL